MTLMTLNDHNALPYPIELFRGSLFKVNEDKPTLSAEKRWLWVCRVQRYINSHGEWPKTWISRSRYSL